MATFAKKSSTTKRLKIDFAEIVDVYIHRSQECVALLSVHGHLFTGYLSTGASFVACRDVNKDRSFRSFCWDDGSQSAAKPKGLALCCDSDGLSVHEFIVGNSLPSGSADITNLVANVNYQSSCLQLLHVDLRHVILLVGELVLKLRLQQGDTWTAVAEVRLQLSDYVEEGIHVQRVVVLCARSKYDASQSTVAVWMSDDELYFWNLNALAGSSVIATLNLRCFRPSESLNTLDVSLSDDGSYLCVVYSDGSLSVVDRDAYLRENPQRRSHAFRYVVEPRSTMSPNLSAFDVKSLHEFSPSPVAFQMGSPSTSFSTSFSYSSMFPSGGESREGTPVRSSMLEFDTQSGTLRRCASSAGKFLPDIVPVRRRISLCSDVVSESTTRASAVIVDSRAANLPGNSPVRDFPSRSGMTSPTDVSGVKKSPSKVFGSILRSFSGASQTVNSMPQSQSFPQIQQQSGDDSSSDRAGASAASRDVACHSFKLPFWDIKGQCRKLVWSGPKLFIWASESDFSSAENHTITAFILPTRRVFYFRTNRPCIPLLFNTKEPKLLTSSGLVPFRMSDKPYTPVNKLEISNCDEIAASLCRLVDWHRSSIPLKALENSLTANKLDTIESFLTSTECGFQLCNPSTNASSESGSSSPVDPSFQSPVAASFCYFYQHDNIDRFEAALRVVTCFIQYVGNLSTAESGNADIQYLHRLVSTVISFCVRVVACLAQNLVTCYAELATVADGEKIVSEAAEESAQLLKMVVSSALGLRQCFEEIDISRQDCGFESLKRETFVAVVRFLSAGDVINAQSLLGLAGYNVADELHRLCLYSADWRIRDAVCSIDGILCPEELEAVAFLRQLESLYRCRSFEAVRNHREIASKWSNSEVDVEELDAAPVIVSEMCGSVCPVTRCCRQALHSSELCCQDGQHSADGYAEVLLAWVLDWTEEQRRLILIERLIALESSTSAADSLSAITFQSFGIEASHVWTYFCLHSNMTELISWANASFQSGSKPTLWPLCEPVTADMIVDLEKLPPRLNNCLLDIFIQHGVVSPKELSDIPRLVRRLVRNQLLMVRPSPLEGLESTGSSGCPGPDGERTEAEGSRSLLSQVHCHVIEQCITDELPEFLYSYLDFWRLSLSGDELCQLGVNRSLIPPWLRMMISFRRAVASNAEAIFEASLASNAFVGEQSSSVDEMLTSGGHLVCRAVGTLMYKPDMIQQIMNEKNPAVVQSIAAFPRLSSIIFPTLTPPSQSSLTVYHLLKSDHLIDPSLVFHWQPSNPLSAEVLPAGVISVPHFTDVELVTHYGHVESLRFPYYLKLGRPGYAFYAFVKAVGGRTEGQNMTSSITRASRTAQRLAVNNFRSVKVKAACIVFLRLLGQDTSLLRLLLQSASQIADSRTVCTSPQTSEAKICRLISSCLRGKREPLIEINELLQDAIRSNIDKLQVDRCSYSAGQKWLLSMLFTRHFDLTDNIELLKNCALSNNWLMFLVFAELFQSNPSQLVEVIQHFSSAAVREHLQHALHSFLGPAQQNGDVIDLLLKHQTNQSERSTDDRFELLSVAIATDNMILPVFATCYQGYNTTACLCVWLIIAGSTRRQNSPLRRFRKSERWDSGTLREIFKVLLALDAVDVLKFGVDIFLPKSLLSNFLGFIGPFLLDLSAVDNSLLDTFCANFNKESVQNRCRTSFSLDWIASVVVLLIEHTLATRCPHWAGKLISSLILAALPEQLKRNGLPDVLLLHRLHQIVAHVNVKLSYVTLGHRNDRRDFEAEVRRVVDELKSQSLNDAARSFASAASVGCDDITIDELASLMREMQQSAAWLMEDMRSEFWKKCQSTLLEHDVTPTAAARFLQEQVTEGQSYLERAALLQLAYDCLPPDNIETSSQRQDLYQTLWRCRINQHAAGQQLLHKQHSGIRRSGLRVSSTQVPTVPVEPVELTELEERGLQEILGLLLDAGEVTDAERVMRVFGRSILPVHIIVACLKLLLGVCGVNDLDSDLRVLVSSPIGPHNRSRPTHQSFITLPLIGHIIGSVSKAIPDIELEVGSSCSKEYAVHRLLTHCWSGQSCCRFIVAVVSICQLTGLTFDEVLTNDEFDILRKLFATNENSRFSLAKDFVMTLGISDSRLASFLCDAFLESVEIHTNIVPSDATTSHTTPILRLPTELCSVETRSKSGFIELIQLSTSCEVLGNQLIAAVKALLQTNQIVSEKLLVVQVIMLVFASDCFIIAASTTGISTVLATAKRVVHGLAGAQEYQLMVYLLASVGKYNEMNYVFDTLKENNRFELLFTEELCKEDQLRLAVMDYLKRFHPTDMDTMALVARRFGMHRALAQHLEQVATARLQTLRGKTVPRHMSDIIRSALDEYIQAAELYAKVKCTDELKNCLLSVRLLTLQTQLMKSTGLRVVNLLPEEAVAYVRTSTKFNEACIVSDAYSLFDVWTDVVIERGVKDGSFDYINDLANAKRFTNEIFTGVVHRFSTVVLPSSGRNAARYVANMKRLLSYCESVRHRYQLASQLGLMDVCQDIAADEYVASYLKDPPLYKNVVFKL